MRNWVGTRAVAAVAVTLCVAACGGHPHVQPDGGANGGGGTGGAGPDAGPDLGPGSGSTGGVSGASGGMAMGGAGGAGGNTVPRSALALDGSPIYTRLQLLTAAQWERAVVDNLRMEPGVSFAGTFHQSPLGGAEFSNNEKALQVELQSELDFETGAEAAAALATGSADALARLYTGTDAAGFVRTVGRRAFRRPLTAAEETRYQTVFTVGETIYGSGFANGAALVLRALLQSPAFLYRSELGVAGQPLDGYEAASKLSFWLRGTTPDDSLLDAAAAGTLDSADGLERAARTMLEEPAAAAVMREFHGQAFHIDRFNQLDPARFAPAFRAELAEASHRFFEAVFTRGEGVREILTSARGFFGPALSASYGVVPPPASIEERTLGGSRAGYLMQVPFLTSTGADAEADTFRRGAAVHRDVLCNALSSHTTMPDPLPALMTGETNRHRIERVTAGCASCHVDYIDPLGFAFEEFDGLGQARSTDNGGMVKTEASYPFATGRRTFADAAALTQLLADDPQVYACYAKKLVGYALQRDVVEADRPLLGELAGATPATTSRSIKEMIVNLVRSPAFRLRAEGTP